MVPEFAKIEPYSMIILAKMGLSKPMGKLD
jgi:hypothetical protein